MLLFWESFLGNFLFSICMLYGVALSTALAAGVIMAALPAAVALLSRLVLKEALEPRVLAGIACAVGGIAVVALVKADAGQAAQAGQTGPMADAWRQTWGHLLLIGAVFCEASYVIIGKQLTGHVGARRISAIVNLWGLALVSPMALWQAVGYDFGSVTLSTWGLLGFYAMAASTVTVWLWMTGLRSVPASQAVMLCALRLRSSTLNCTAASSRASAFSPGSSGEEAAGTITGDGSDAGMGRGNGNAQLSRNVARRPPDDRRAQIIGAARPPPARMAASAVSIVS